MEQQNLTNVALIVAYPDEETLWAGGTIISNPGWQCDVVCLCKKNDRNRASVFFEALTELGANGFMGNLDDGPEQLPLQDSQLQQMIQQLMPDRKYDLIITHNPDGEYASYHRHQEISRAVINLWAKGLIAAKQLWTFAYQEGESGLSAEPRVDADRYHILEQSVYERKYNIITQTYGFETGSREAQNIPENEAFWHFQNPVKAMQWLVQGGRPRKPIQVPMIDTRAAI